VEDEGRVLRFRLDGVDRVRIGRDQSNDIWVDHPAVKPHTALIYKRESQFCLKVYDGAKVLLNKAPVAGMHHLYSGDRIGIADREFVYGRDDTAPDIAVGLTVMQDGAVQHAVVYQRTCIRVGRRDAEVLLSDPTVSDQHLVIECYSGDGLYAFDLGSATGTLVNGTRVEERCRLYDNDLLQVGHMALRVTLLPSDAHGLLMLQRPTAEDLKIPPMAPPPMNKAPGQRLDPSALSPQRRQGSAGPVAGGFVRPLHQQNASTGIPAICNTPPPAPLPEPSERDPNPMGHVPVTEVGSLQDILARAKAASRDAAPRPTPSRPESPTQPQPQAPVVPPTRIIDAVSHQEAERWAEQAAARPQPGQVQPSARPSQPMRAPAPQAPVHRPHADEGAAERPAVHVKPEVYAAADEPLPDEAPQERAPGQRQPQQRAPVWQDWSSQREHLQVKPRESVRDDMVAVSAMSSQLGFHEQFTQTLDTNAVEGLARGKAQWMHQDGMTPEQAAARVFQQRQANQPLTEAADTGRARDNYGVDRGRYRISKPGRQDNAWVDDEWRRDRPPPVPLDRRSETDRRANPDWDRAPQAPEPQAPAGPRSGVDGSRRSQLVRHVDGSRRLPDEEPPKR
jgi:pSer/pThr/pTyr-binding forkhead associated (FHA) protein